MKTFFLLLALLVTTTVFGQSSTPFDTLQVVKSDLTKMFIELDEQQAKDIAVLNERTKCYVIAVFAEEKPGTKLFIARMEDIKRHRDYTLRKILSEEQYLAYSTKSAFISKTIVTENR